MTGAQILVVTGLTCRGGAINAAVNGVPKSHRPTLDSSTSWRETLQKYLTMKSNTSRLTTSMTMVTDDEIWSGIIHYIHYHTIYRSHKCHRFMFYNVFGLSSLWVSTCALSDGIATHIVTDSDTVDGD